MNAEIKEKWVAELNDPDNKNEDPQDLLHGLYLGTKEPGYTIMIENKNSHRIDGKVPESIPVTKKWGVITQEVAKWAGCQVDPHFPKMKLSGYTRVTLGLSIMYCGEINRVEMLNAKDQRREAKLINRNEFIAQHVSDSL